jgi:hypothetical protein
LPAGWQADELRAAKLSANGPEDVRVSVEGGRIRASVEARQPVIVYRNEAARQRSRNKSD